KSILDLGLTLEYLETKGVPVVGYQTEELPAFYTRESGFKVNYRMDSPLEIAKALKAKEELNLKGGMVIANPIPHEYSMDSKLISKAIDDAVEEANKLGIKGKDTTPFLLDKVQKITEGKSLEANIQLVYNNAKLAAQIASELCKL
ncbi:MAG: pseudouridine-5'-phosphate glycosidase, partial [Tissierellia bacterium]|nr:pseudouridine-5'-phosphate glycosidase [Tissierellia bacterium]